MYHTEGCSPSVPDNTGSPPTFVRTIVTSRTELETYAVEWNELLLSSDANTIFLTWEWISVWLEVVYPDANLFVVAVRDDKGRLIAIAPFYRSDLYVLGLAKYRCLRVIGDCVCGGEYPDIIVRRGFENKGLVAVMQELAEHPGVWDCIWIPNMAGWTSAHEGFGRVCKQLGFYVHELTRKFSIVKLPDTHEAYFKLLSRNRREQIRRKTRRLREFHDVELVYCDHKDKLPKLLSRLFALHRRRWESVGQTGSFVRKPLMKRFYQSFGPVALREGWLRIYALKVDGVINAIQYGYAYGGIFYQLQEGFEPDGFDGIGNILRNLVIKACIKEGLHGYDFLGGFSDHKRRWRAELREGCDLFIGSRSLKNQLLFWKNIWPRGRFIQEGRPANEGRSHDDETISISTVCGISGTLNIIRKIKFFVFFSTTHQFIVLPLKTVRECQARIPIVIVPYDRDHECPDEILDKIKGKKKDWRNRWVRGDLCYVAYADEEPIAYSWIRHGEWHLRGKDKGSPLPPRSAFSYGSRTLEEWRGKKVFPALLSKVAVDLSSRSYDYLYGQVNERNIASWRGVTRLGFSRTEHHIQQYRFLKVFTYRRDRVSFSP